MTGTSDQPPRPKLKRKIRHLRRRSVFVDGGSGTTGLGIAGAAGPIQSGIVVKTIAEESARTRRQGR